MGAERMLEHQGAAGVPYNAPPEVLRLGLPSHGRGDPVVSDTPWKPDRADLITCAGTRTNGATCKQVVYDPSKKHCTAHLDQE